MKYERQISGDAYQVNLKWDDHSACISAGHFGEVRIEEGPLFHAVLKNVHTKEIREVCSRDVWEHTKVKWLGNTVCLRFWDQPGMEEIMFVVKGAYDHLGISWTVEVINDNRDWSVMAATYPVPQMSAESFDFFVPLYSGIVVKDAGKRGYKRTVPYPGAITTMQYFAVYGETGGIYIGLEDGEGAAKKFDLLAENDHVSIKATFHGINASRAANSFDLFGHCRWQHITGDWYDATMLYANFVRNKASWLPQINEHGRMDTPQRFKEVPFWVSDYIPNSPSQGNNKPMTLSAGSDVCEKDYWINAVIELQEKLQVPIAYHVYNWHQIPFNIEYPHFMPAKEEFIEGAKKLREHPIYILPYINAVSWEMHDAEMNHEINFENTGRAGAVIRDNGEISLERYPQKTLSGEKSLLAHVCPTYPVWHRMMRDLAVQMERELPIDGIYFDQIAATSVDPCYNTEHNHLPGGGNHWVTGFQKMMEKISATKPGDNFYFTECNAETYTKSFDGFLTWMWVHNGEVPAFAAVYAGYIEMLGRFTIGNKKGDYDFFKYTLACSLLSGQQLGWCKADVIFDEKRMVFLKRMVDVRREYTELFHCSDMLRPPKVTTSIQPKVTTPAKGYKENVVMDQIKAGAWKYRNHEKIVLFCVNTADAEGDYCMTFPVEEYGLCEYELPEEFVIEGSVCRIKGMLAAENCKVWELKKIQE